MQLINYFCCILLNILPITRQRQWFISYLQVVEVTHVVIADNDTFPLYPAFFAKADTSYAEQVETPTLGLQIFDTIKHDNPTITLLETQSNITGKGPAAVLILVKWLPNLNVSTTTDTEPYTTCPVLQPSFSSSIIVAG